MNIYSAYTSKHNLNHKNQIVIFMIPNGKGYYYYAIKKISALLRGITSKYVSYSDCLNCFHPFRTKDNDNDTINKQTVQIVWKDDNLLHLQKKFEDNSPNDKNYRKIILVNTDLLHRAI